MPFLHLIGIYYHGTNNDNGSIDEVITKIIIYTYMPIHVCVHIYIYIYMCVCMRL